MSSQTFGQLWDRMEMLRSASSRIAEMVILNLHNMDIDVQPL